MNNFNIPRPEHPNPQWERESWRSLNGEWEFDFDFSKSAVEKEAYKNELSKKIVVPFCPESVLSKIEYTDFIPSVCYRRKINLSKEEISGNVFLHFGAVDFKCYIYINEKLCDTHIGGYSSFKVDITEFVTEGENTVFVICEDDVRGGLQPAGKQSSAYASKGCYYTRVTGIWQTVWLEFVPKSYVKFLKYYPDITNGILTVEGEVKGSGELSLSSFYEEKSTGSIKINVNDGPFFAQIKLSELHLWEIGAGRLYDLFVKFNDDTVKSYFGMREVNISGNKFLINKKPVFLKMILDQGYYQDGIYTAKSDEDLRNDIIISKNIGFDGARLHEKVFEKRFLYHCDKEGYIVWGEHANWNMDHKNPVAQGNFINEWAEIIKRDFNHPSIIGWCPYNETWKYIEKETNFRYIESVYNLTKLYDNTRPCIDVSGNYHLDKREIYDVHDYEQDPVKFREYYAHIDEGTVNDQIQRKEKDIQPYFGEPVFVSEYGGIKWAPGENAGWGYGNAPKTEEEFISRYTELADALISNPHIAGLCYTQLYDVEQEQNGLYYYDRTPKFSKENMDRLKKAMTKSE